ncbi:MAG: cob(I)yrinic acid a,c-diamide adenosyltransferase [Bdellovibrionales bacterium]|nr:cob(I)yrinic acid a,c-diamide adenosyltransferase [Bdellovibrionales bacterium]
MTSAKKSKIYTKGGDKGQTSLVGGTRVPKTHMRLEAYGTLDELNSMIGVIRSHLAEAALNTDILRTHVEARLQRIQNCLFDIGSHLACESAEIRQQLPQIKPVDLAALETDMDMWDSELPALKNFILPGGSRLACFAHMARTICRRGERAILSVDAESLDPQHIVYINRLSDWFFVLARKFNASAGVTDLQWSKD